MNNVLIIHGGGLVDPSKEVILRIARGLYNEEAYNNIYIGRYSFMSLSDDTLWLRYDEKLEELLKCKRGTYLGTCRGIDFTDFDLFRKSIIKLQYNKIKTIIVCGGDGSSRQCAEICESFQEHGINIIFAVPLTVDGINGGHSIGIDQATREATRQIENICATSLQTRDNGNFSVVAVELQGRNRDDILATVLQTLHRQRKVADLYLDDVLLRVVPANYFTSEKALIDEVNSSKFPTLILLSEGAKIKMADLTEKIKRKVRTVFVGHSVQSNGMTTKEDMEKYSEWLTDVVNLILDKPYASYSIVNDGISRWREPIDYYAKLNPREHQEATMSKGLSILMEDYMVENMD